MKRLVTIVFLAMLTSDVALSDSGESNRQAALRVKSVFSSVGIEFDTVISNPGVKDEAFKTTVFRNGISCQIIHGGFASVELPSFAPLTHETLANIKTYPIHLATTKPNQKYATFNLANPIVGEYTYIQGSNPEAFFVTALTPALVDLSPFQSSRYQRSDLYAMYDVTKQWEPFVHDGTSGFCVELSKREWKTDRGRVLPFRSLLAFTFDSPEKGIPSHAWVTGEWTLGQGVYLVPKNQCSPQWSFSDWRLHPIGVMYPHEQIETNSIHDVGIPHLLDESTGLLAKLERGEHQPVLEPGVRKVFSVKDWNPIAHAKNLFLEPTDGNVVRDVDSNELFVTGKSKEESNELLGIREPRDDMQASRSYGRYLAIGSGAIIAIIAVFMLRRRQ